MDLGDELHRLTAAEALPADYPDMAMRWLLPLAEWLMARRAALGGGALLVGINGAQGTGKTTACRALELMIAHLGAHAVTLSIDDFYLDRSARRLLARVVHPLLETRGVPGTHEVELLEEVLDTLVVRAPARVPIFDKALDDRVPDSEWLQVAPGDIVMIEGWCVGARPEPEEALLTPVNALERSRDGEGEWRRYVNEQLAGPYRELYDKLHCLVMLKAPSFDCVLGWRQLQESKLAARRAGVGVMTAEQIEEFIAHYERVTRHCLAEMPSRADYILEIDSEHQFAAGGAR
ncbi:MAG: hypothetical protein AAGI24_11230 [Pseudomonadota bacterium]